DPDSPAGGAGLQTGDVILEVNGQAPRSFIDFADLLAARANEVGLKIQRSTGEKNLMVRMVPVEKVFNAELIRSRVGLTVEPLTDEEIAERYPLTGAPGMFLVDAVQENSPAAA